MTQILENETKPIFVVCAFRGSGKSTIMSLIYPMWAILGKQQKKYVIISSLTQEQSHLLLSNVRQEFERNKLLINDYKLFNIQEVTDEWRKSSLIIPSYDARIMASSFGASTRGFRNAQYRPDLIVIDDPEDVDSVKTEEGRDKTFAWFSQEIMPAGDTNTKVVVSGNMLDIDSLIMRLKKESKTNPLITFRRYPFFQPDGITPLWKEKFPTEALVQELRAKVISDVAWLQEYELTPVINTKPMIKSEWIKYFAGPAPVFDKKCWFRGVGIDPAISTNDTADCTSMVQVIGVGHGKDLMIYVLPRPFNGRITYYQQIEIAKQKAIFPSGKRGTLYVESVAYQAVFVQTMKHEGYRAEEVKLYGKNKEERVNAISYLFEMGTIVFPEEGCEELIHQLLRFPFDKHDDLVDALSLVIFKLLEEESKPKSGLFIAEVPKHNEESKWHRAFSVNARDFC